jgi:CheY-like chemotaxis protein
MQILFVDDVLDTRTFFQLALGATGHVVHPVASGALALQALQQHSYDAIVLDVEMPEMSGWEALQRIRAQLGQGVPIVMFTAYYNDDMIEQAHAAGADHIVGKPLLPAQLLKILTDLVEERHPLHTERADQRDQ